MLNTASFSIECLTPVEAAFPRSILRPIVTIAAPVTALLLHGVFWFCVAMRSAESWEYLEKRWSLSFLAVSYLTCVRITKNAVNVLSCVRVRQSIHTGAESTSYRWTQAATVKCFAGSHAILVSVLSLPVLLFFTLGFPVLLSWKLLRKKNLDPSHESWFMDATAFLYRAYADRFVYWESLVLFRKALLTIVVAVGYHLGSNLQAILAVCILTTALYLHTICHPFRNEFAGLNVYEEAVLFFSNITFVMALLFNDDRIGNALRVVLSVLFFLSICGLLAFLGFVFSQATFAYMRVVLEIEEVPQIDALGNLRVMREFMILKVAQNVPRTRSFIPKSKSDEEQANIGLNARRDSTGFSSGL